MAEPKNNAAGILSKGGGNVTVTVKDNAEFHVRAGDSSTSDSSEMNKRKDFGEEGVEKLTEHIFISKKSPLRKRTTLYPGHQVNAGQLLREVAIKAITPYQERNVKEVDLLLKLASHPNVVQMIQSITDPRGLGTLYIVMELCNKENLQDLLDRKRREEVPFDFKQAMSFTQELVDGIRHIHKNNIVHGDIKPGNVLFSLDGKHVKVADFGVSKELRDGRSLTKPDYSGIGTNGFRAPETYNNKVISRKSDIYSLGMTFSSIFSHGMHLCGDDPDLVNYRIKTGEPFNFTILLIQGKKRRQLEELLKRMLQYEADKRISIEAVSEDRFFSITESSNEDDDIVAECVLHEQLSQQTSTDETRQAEESNDEDADDTVEDVLQEPVREPLLTDETSQSEDTESRNEDEDAGAENALQEQPLGQQTSTNERRQIEESKDSNGEDTLHGDKGILSISDIPAYRRKPKKEWHEAYLDPKSFAILKQFNLEPDKLRSWRVEVKYRGKSSKQYLLDFMDGGYRFYHGFRRWSREDEENGYRSGNQGIVVNGATSRLVTLGGIKLPECYEEPSVWQVLDVLWPGLGIWLEVKTLELFICVCNEEKDQVSFENPFNASVMTLAQEEVTRLVSIQEYLGWFQWSKTTEHSEVELEPTRVYIVKRPSGAEVELELYPRMFESE